MLKKFSYYPRKNITQEEKLFFVGFQGVIYGMVCKSSKKTSKCNFCDTDFVGVDGINGGKYTLSSLINKI